MVPRLHMGPGSTYEPESIFKEYLVVKILMHKNALSLISSCAALALVASGCGKSLKDRIDGAESALESSELQHTFVQEKCNDPLVLKVIGLTTKASYEFAGKEVRRTQHYYSAADCQGPAIDVTYVGTYEKKAEVQKNVWQLDMNFTSVAAVALNDSGKGTLNTTGFCGKSYWQVNVPADLTAHARDALCPLTDLPDPVFDLYTVENNVLFFGKTSDKSAPTKRPGELEREDAYHQL